MPGQSGRPAIRCLQRGPQAGSPAERAPARLLRIPACRPGHSVSPPTAKMGRRTGLSAVGMNQPQPRGTHGPGNRPAEARQFGSTATPPDYRGSAVFGPCGSSRQPSTAGWVQSCPAGACRRVPRWLPIRPMRRAKLPVFFRSSFLAGALRTAISSALMQWNNMPHRPGAGAQAGVIDGSGQCCWPRRSWSCTCPGYRSGPRRDTCTVVVQMDASMADAALDVEDPPGAGEESGMRKLSDAPMSRQGIRVTFSGLISRVLMDDVWSICWVADKTGRVHSGEGKLLLGHAQQGRNPGTADESLAGQHGCGSRFAGQAVPGELALAGGAEVAVDLAGDVTLQAADDLFLRQAFLGAPLDIGQSRRVGAHPGEHDPP